MCVLLRCQAFLIKEGFVSRKKTNKRGTTVEEMLKCMTFWCRFVRQVVLTTPQKPVPEGCLTGADASASCSMYNSAQPVSSASASTSSSSTKTFGRTKGIKLDPIGLLDLGSYPMNKRLNVDQGPALSVTCFRAVCNFCTRIPVGLRCGGAPSPRRSYSAQPVAWPIPLPAQTTFKMSVF